MAFWNRLSLSPVFDNQDVCTHYIGIQQDITQYREQEAQIAYQATHDLLTGLHNHTALDKFLGEAFERVEQAQGLLVVMHLDLDGFKAVNDGLGHHIGNLLLVAVAERLEQLVAPGDTVARLTGDEFALLLPSVDSIQAGKAFAERVLETLSTPVLVTDKPLHITLALLATAIQ